LKLIIDDTSLQERVFLPKGLNCLVKEIGVEEKKKLGEICIIFVDGERILDINKQYLGHQYLTDVITFDNSGKGIVKGDIFICVEEVYRNAAFYQSGKEIELLRVILHGILHLCGYGDKTEHEKAGMRGREDFYLQMAERMQLTDGYGFKL
jgi:rRNA maturation RNase YbeY